VNLKAFAFGIILSSCRARQNSELNATPPINIGAQQATQQIPEVNGVMLQGFHWYTPAGGTHWNTLSSKAPQLKKMGVTAIWLPPAYKGSSEFDVGYGVYDMWDLGEFKQKNPNMARTKYGTKSEYLKLIDTLHSNGIQVYADVVMNHKLGSDGTTPVTVKEVNPRNRTQVTSAAYSIDAYVRFDFPGRPRNPNSNTGPDFKWQPYHFTGVDWDNSSRQQGKVFLIDGAMVTTTTLWAQTSISRTPKYAVK
jgi:alpha-amylase